MNTFTKAQRPLEDKMQAIANSLIFDARLSESAKIFYMTYTAIISGTPNQNPQEEDVNVILKWSDDKANAAMDELFAVGLLKQG